MGEETVGNEKGYGYYANMISDEFIDAFTALDRETIALLLYLLDKKEATLIEIHNFAGNVKMFNRVDNLQDYGLIANMIRKEKGKDAESFFVISNFGKVILASIDYAVKEVIAHMEEKHDIVSKRFKDKHGYDIGKYK